MRHEHFLESLLMMKNILQSANDRFYPPDPPTSETLNISSCWVSKVHAAVQYSTVQYIGCDIRL